MTRQQSRAAARARAKRINAAMRIEEIKRRETALAERKIEALPGLTGPKFGKEEQALFNRFTNRQRQLWRKLFKPSGMASLKEIARTFLATAQAEPLNVRYS